MEKSTRHSKITGDFGENLILYWLSRSGFESTLVDHTGIDIVAYQKETKQRFGISVKSRSRTVDSSSTGMLIWGDNYEKIMKSCEFFGCDVPSIAFVYDRPSEDHAGQIDVYFLSLESLDKYYPNFKSDRDFSFSITRDSIGKYQADDTIRKIVFKYDMTHWANVADLQR